MNVIKFHGNSKLTMSLVEKDGKYNIEVKNTSRESPFLSGENSPQYVFDEWTSKDIAERRYNQREDLDNFMGDPLGSALVNVLLQSYRKRT